MKRHYFRILAVAILSLTLWACSGTKEPSPLEAQSERLDKELSVIAEESPMYLDSISCSYADAVLSIDIAFADADVENISDPLIRYIVAVYAKGHTGQDLDAVVNTLLKEEGKLSINLSNAKGEKKTCDIEAKTLKRLVVSKLMELDFQAVKENVSEIFEERCDEFKDKVNAKECDFTIQGGFAQYTLTFDSSRAYANLTQGSLTGRYISVLSPIFEDYGMCRSIIEELLVSLDIEGYRFIYKADDNGKELRAAIPWRLIQIPITE